MIPDNLCKMPFMHRYFDFLDDVQKPCCIFSGNDSMKIVKEKFLRNQFPDGCLECKRKEENNLKSKRLYYNNYLKKYDIDSGIKTYDLRLDKICNLKCVMCGPHLSSKWTEDEMVFSKHIGNKHIKKDNDLDFDFSNALEIYFAGGEPFYIKEVYNILNTLSNNSFNRNNTKIRINTNAIFNKNNKIFKLLQKFKKIEITASIEGTEKINNYIRYPSEWNSFLKGVKLLYDISDKPKNVKEILACDKSFVFNITVSSLNLLNLVELFQWLNQKQYVYVINYLEEPNLLHINSLKPNVIQKFLDQLQKNHFDHSKDLFSYIEKYYSFNQQNNDKMKLYLHDLDIIRNTNSRELLNWCWT